MTTVFVSHRGADSYAAARLASDLREGGIEVWLDLDEIRVGDSILERMNVGLERASHVIFIFSDEASLGPWMDREWLSALARQLEGEDVRLLPARIGASTGPSILRDIKYADLANDWNSGVAALRAAVMSTL